MSIPYHLKNFLKKCFTPPLKPYSPSIYLSQPIGIIIVGAGMIAKKHIKALKRIDNVTIKAICAKGDESAQKLAEECSIGSFYAGHKQALDVPCQGNEIVLIATPPNTHHVIAKDALLSGRHVLLEKPACVNPNLMKEIAGLAQERNLIVASCASRFIFSPLTKAVQNIIDSGQLGDLYRIEVVSRTQNKRYGIEFHPEARWALSKEQAGGGALVDWGMYALAFVDSIKKLNRLECIAGQVQKKVCPADLPEDIVYDVEDAAYGLWRADNDLLLSMNIAWSEHGKTERTLSIYGSRGGIKAQWTPPFDLEFFSSDPTGKANITRMKIPRVEYDEELAVIEDFLTAVDKSSEPALTLSHDADLMTGLLECYEKSVLD